MDLSSATQTVAVASAVVTCLGLLCSSGLLWWRAPAGETATERQDRRSSAVYRLMMSVMMPIAMQMFTATLAPVPLESEGSTFSFTAAMQMIRDQALHLYLHAALWVINILTAVIVLTILGYDGWQAQRRRQASGSDHGLPVEYPC